MEALIKLQNNTKNIIEKGKINFKKSPKERITQGYVETRLEALEDQWKKFEDTHIKIIELATVEEMKGTYFTTDIYEKTEEIYVNYKSDLKDYKLKFVRKDDRERESSSGNKSKNIKLPKINIPIFSGSFAEWTSFRDLFTSLVHNNAELDDVEKLHYLKGLLQGEAEQLLRQNPITEANYQLCWAKLEHRYNNKRRLANNILQQLFNQRRINAESSISLKHLLDTTTDCISALSNLGIDVTTWDIIIIYIMASKLDPETRKQWELKVSEDSSNELPTLNQFQTFIEGRFTAFENIEVPKRVTVQAHGFQSSNQRVLLATQKSNFVKHLRCEFCSQNHKICFCKGFIQLDTDKKRQFVSHNKICFNCLGGNHMLGQCKKNTTCKVCKKRHHTLLHADSTGIHTVERDKTGISSGDPNASDVSMPVVSCLSTKLTQPRQVLLATALVKAQTTAHDFQIVRALLDQGSQASFITEATVQLLRLKKSPIRGIVSGIGTGKTSVANYMVTLVLQSLTESGFEIEVKAYVLKNITSYLPERQLEPIRWPDVEHLVLADPHFSKPNRIDVLLGADVYSEVLREGVKKAPTGSIVAQRTSLGWILSGAVQLQPKVKQVNTITAMHVQIEESDILKKFWEIEDQLPNSEKILTEEEQRCEELFASTTRRTTDGRYIVKLPFKNLYPSCVGGSSRDIALKRFYLLERKLNKDQDLKEKYTNVIKEYLQLDHMKKVDSNDNNINDAVYLPHHAVIRNDKSTTRVRVVFDASCKNDKGVSLNDTLMIGPTLQSDLRHIVLRWRTHYIAIVADIVKMYRQIRVAEQDILYQRIVWRDNPNEEIQDYSLTTVTFGTASAPYLAVKSLHQVAVDEGWQYPLAAERVPNSYYMDDMMTGCSTVEAGKILCREMRNLLRKAGFELQKWNSNNEDIIKEMEGYQSDVQDTFDRKRNQSKEEIEIFESAKILGLTWCRRTDEFRYTVQLPSVHVKWSKRNIIADIARLFDPLGWLAPSIILAKIIIQKLWLAGVNWDDEVPDSVRIEWETYRTALSDLSEVRVPRWLGISGDISSVELHGFSDASKSAYAAVVYTRTVHSTNDVRVSLLVARTKVAPIKQVSIPRLELCGAVLLARLLADVAKAMNIPKNKVHAWTDSTVVLAWLNSHPSRWKTFVANRVSEILTTLDADQFAHVSSKNNPADCASRGVSPSLLASNRLWFEGPQFLHNPEVVYNRPAVDNIILEESVKSHVGIAKEPIECPWAKFSSLGRLLRVLAYCRRHSAVDVSNGSARDHERANRWPATDGDRLTTYPATGDRSALLRSHAAKSAECSGQGSPRPRRALRESRRVSLAQASGYVQLNQYRLLEPIGQGSYGIVKLAYNEEDETHYAMKILSKRKLMRRAGLFGRAPPRRPGPGPPPDPLQRVYREIAVLKKLDHPNVVKLVEVLDDPAEDHLYLVFQLLERGPVIDIPTENPLSEHLARKYFRDALLGIEYLHYQRIAHRDIKPANLLLGEDRVQVADLGACGELAAAGRVSGTVGTPAFRAPEAAAPADKYSGEAADIWSLGVTLYAMVTGKVPWVSNSAVELQRKVLNEPLTYPAKCQPSKPLRHLLNRMLDKDPASRATVQEIKDHEWVTNGGKEPLPSEQENCRLVEVTDEDMAQVVTSIPNLSTLILIKTMLKKHSFQNPFLRSREGSSSRRESTSSRGEPSEKPSASTKRAGLARAGRSLSAPGNYLTDRQTSFDIGLESVQESRDQSQDTTKENTPQSVSETLTR